jgi:hypothetical protein
MGPLYRVLVGLVVTGLAAGEAGCDTDSGATSNGGAGVGGALDGGAGPGGATDGGAGTGGSSDGGASQGGGGASTGCIPARLTYYDVAGAGACEVMDVPSALPQIARDGLTAAMSEPWFGGSQAGDFAEACGECWEITTADATRTVVITDLCPVEGNPICAGDFFHFDVAHTAAVPLGYEPWGVVEAAVRRVPCPVEGNIFAIVRDANPWYVRLTLGSIRVAIRTVEYRGAGAGVSSTNPWTAMERSGGAWAASGDGDTLARGGTGIVLRLTTAQGQTVESSVIIAEAAAALSAIDLGVQVDDQSPPSGPACTWRPPDPYVDELGGIEAARWEQSGWGGGTVDLARATGCRAGTCIGVSGLEGWGGIQFFYNQAFPIAGLGYLSLQASAPASVPLELKLMDAEGGECAATAFTAEAEFGRVEVDLATACAGLTSVRFVQLQLMRAEAADFVLDDIVFE